MSNAAIVTSKASAAAALVAIAGAAAGAWDSALGGYSLLSMPIVLKPAAGGRKFCHGRLFVIGVF